MNRLHEIMHYPPALSLAGLLLLDGLFFGLTNPKELASFWLIIAFLLLAATLYRASRLGFKVLSWYGLHPKRPKRLAAGLAVIITGLLALQSIGELTDRDMIVSLPLFVLLYLYLSRGGLQAASERR
jgi:hypothetical protein